MEPMKGAMQIFTRDLARQCTEWRLCTSDFSVALTSDQIACERAHTHNLSANLGFDMEMTDMCAMPGHSKRDSPTNAHVQRLVKMKRLAVSGNYQ